MNKSLVNAAEQYEPDVILLSHCKNVSNKTLQIIKGILPELRIIYTNVDPLSASDNVRDIEQRVGIADAIFITTAGDGLRQFVGEKSQIHYFPNPVDKAIDTMCAYKNTKANIDLLFLGRALRHMDDHRESLAKYLTTKNKGYIRSYVGGLGVNQNLHYGAEYLKTLNNSKMGICLSKVANHYLYASDRFSHYLAAGILTFIPTGSHFEDVLGSGTFVEFDSHDDLWRKIIHFSDNAEERVATAKKGYEAAHLKFDVEKVCQFMLEVAFREPLSQDYSWPTHPATAL